MQMALVIKSRSYDTFFEDYLSLKKEGTRKQYHVTLDSDFEVFTKTKYKKSLEQMIKEFKKIKKVEKIIDVLQDWVNQSKIELRNKKNRVSLLNTYLYYRGIKIDSRDMRLQYGNSQPEQREEVELGDLRKIIAKANAPETKALYLSMLTSGMTIEEVCSIKKKDIDVSMSRMLVNIPRSYTKANSRGRKVFISKEAGKILSSVLVNKKNDGFVYHNFSSAEIGKENEDARLRRIVDSLGLGERYESGTRKITSHAFRAYFFTKANQINGLQYAHKMTGHKRPSEDEYNRITGLNKMLELYLKVEPELLIFEEKPETKKIQNIKTELENVKRDYAMQFSILKDGYYLLKEMITGDPIDSDDYIKIYRDLKQRIDPVVSLEEREHFRYIEKLKAEDRRYEEELEKSKSKA